MISMQIRPIKNISILIQKDNEFPEEVKLKFYEIVLKLLQVKHSGNAQTFKRDDVYRSTRTFNENFREMYFKNAEKCSKGFLGC